MSTKTATKQKKLPSFTLGFPPRSRCRDIQSKHSSEPVVNGQQSTGTKSDEKVLMRSLHVSRSGEARMHEADNGLFDCLIPVGVCVTRALSTLVQSCRHVWPLRFHRWTLSITWFVEQNAIPMARRKLTVRNMEVSRA
jgi:hypothetical protein